MEQKYNMRKTRRKYVQFIPVNNIKKQHSRNIYHDKPLTSFKKKVHALSNKVINLGYTSVNQLDKKLRLKLLKELGFLPNQYKKVV